MEGENIGDWLYFIFLIIAGISSLFSSKNKKKKRPKQINNQSDNQEEVPHENEEVLQGDLWEVLQKMQDPKTSPSPQPVIIPQKQSVKHTDKQSITKTNVSPQFTQREENNSFDIELTQASELRKAVIYAEILNRKF